MKGLVKHWNRLSREVMGAPYLESQAGWGSEQPDQAVESWRVGESQESWAS